MSPKQRSRSVDELRIQEFEDVDVQNPIDAVLSTIDRLEDKFDQEAYELLIPFNIRMALENQIFGWDHLYSATLGHVLLPAASYALIYWLVSLVGLRGVTCHYTWQCTIHKVYGFEEGDYVPIFGIGMLAFGYIRAGLGLWSALSTFRTIRRRRKVWLHHQATEYFRNNTVAHLDMKRVDRETLLGRIRSRVNHKKDSWLNRRVMRKVTKATRRFEKRDKRRRREFYDGSAEFEVDHHQRVQMLSKRGGASASKRGVNDDDEFDASVPFYDNAIVTTNLDEQESREKTEYDEAMDADVFSVTYQRYKHSGKEEYERGEHAGELSAKHFYGHTMPAFAMQSIAQDQIRFENGLIQNVAYAHGGFFGAAPFMLANPHWIHILRQLMPDVYVEISRRVVNTPVPQLIHWAENNPVVAAYGTAHELEYFGKVPTLEWDIFLDPHLVQRVEVVLEARDSFVQGLSNNSKRVQTALSHKRPERRYTGKLESIAALLKSDEKKILHFYNTEIDKRVLLLLEHMLIAHGNLSQLALEQTGFLKQYNFSRVKHTRRTLGGGIYAKHWFMTYAEALKMSTELDEDAFADDETSMNTDDSPVASTPNSQTSSPRRPRYSRDGEDAPLLSSSRHDHSDDISGLNESGLRRRGSPSAPAEQNENRTGSPQGKPMKPSTSFQDLALAAVTTSSITESMNTLKKIMNCEAPLGLVLDIKSRHVPKRVWALVLDTLRGMGARVEGIATFYQEDIRDMSKYCAAPVKEILFFHSAGDMQQACHNGLLRRGDSVFFNAGSLFWNYPVLKDKDFFSKIIGNACAIKFDAEEFKKQYKFQRYARVAGSKPDSDNTNMQNGDEDSATDALLPPLPVQNDEDTCINFHEGQCSTIQQYKEQFDLSIGLYVQEFAIDGKSMDLLVQYVNMYDNVYDLGFSWGGVNGVTVRGIQPGRFTNTDGFWNQRYVGKRWDENLYPGGLH